MCKEKRYAARHICAFADGERIDAAAFIPSVSGGRLPAVILSHGYNSCQGDLCDVAVRLAENGAAAVVYDFRGGSVNSRSEGSSLKMSIRSEMKDLAAVVDEVSGMEEIDQSRVYLYGESQGGLVTALTAAESPQRFCGIFLLYPAFCIPDDWRGRRVDGEIELMGMRLSDEYIKGLPEYDVFERIKNYTGRVVIGHGSADRVVSVEYSRRAQKCFPDCRLVEYSGEGHGFAPAARKEWAELVRLEVRCKG